MRSAPDIAPSLARAEVRRFHEEGWLGPFASLDSVAMGVARSGIEAQALGRDSPFGRERLMSRHLDCPAVRELCAQPAIVGRVASILGPDLLMWNSYLWNKEPGGKPIPWHQDIDYWPIEPWVTVTAWVAIDRVDRGNSCVRIVPGSHRRMVPHVDAPPGAWFAKGADPAQVDEAKAIDIELEAGQFFLFNERLLHGSKANASTRRRLGMSARYTLPQVHLARDRGPLFAGHRAMLVAGEDRFGWNPLIDPAGRELPVRGD